MTLLMPKRLSSGKYVDLINFTEQDIDINDIENSLSQQTRFTGHFKDHRPLTVKEHSYLTYLLCLDLFPTRYDYQLLTFIHDFEEAYIGDIITPVKKLVGVENLKFVESIDNTIHSYFYRIPTKEERKIVKQFDKLALDIERRIMWKSTAGKDNWPEVDNSVYTKKEREEFFFSAIDISASLKLEDTIEQLHDGIKSMFPTTGVATIDIGR